MLGDAAAAAVLPVKDLDAAKKFYEETLGLKKENESPGGVTYRSGNSHVFIYPTQYAGTNQATAIGWVIEDVAGAAETLKAKGVMLEHYDLPGVTREGDVHIMGDLKAIWFKDPDGNILNVVNQMG